jgi:hypothetical protein
MRAEEAGVSKPEPTHTSVLDNDLSSGHHYGDLSKVLPHREPLERPTWAGFPQPGFVDMEFARSIMNRLAWWMDRLVRGYERGRCGRRRSHRCDRGR